MLSKASNFTRNHFSQSSMRTATLAFQNARLFAAPTKECSEHLKASGIRAREVVHNPTVAELYEYAMQPEHLKSVDPSIYATTIADSGALSVSSGSKTGRTPKDKRVVLDETTKDTIWWGKVNIPISPEGYARNRKRAVDFLSINPRLFVIDGYAGWDTDYRLKVRVISTRPYHALFMKQMLIRGTNEQLDTDFKKGIDFTIFNAGEFNADPHTENVTSETSVNVNFKAKELTILGT